MSRTPGQYEYTPLSCVRWGVDAVQACAEEAEARGSDSVLIVASPSLRKASAKVDQLAHRLGGRCAGIFDDLEPHAPSPRVVALYQRTVDVGADLLISMGGGTPIDSAKVVIAMHAAGVSDPLAVANAANDWAMPSLRQIACPTTLSGAEFSDLAGLTDPKTLIKHGVAGRGIGPDCVILDEELASHTPADLWASTGIRAVDHAVETLCSIAATPFTDALAKEALRILPAALRADISEDADKAEARKQAQLAVWLASAGLDRTPYGASHGVGHQLGAVAGVPHGICSCVMLPTVLDWNLSRTGPQQAVIADILGAPSASEGVRALVSDLGLPTRLSQAGVRRDQLGEIAEKSVGNRWVRTNPRSIGSGADILDILNKAF